MECNSVLVADRVRDFKGADVTSRHLEHADDDYFADVYNALSAVSARVTHYESPRQFIDNAAKHANDVVLTIWSGERSRNRRALVPATCEACGIAYVGADPYFQLISADKQIAKAYARRFGIESARGVQVDCEEDIGKIKMLEAPLVVKPNFEGGSIGIFRQSYATTHKSAKRVCNQLLAHYPSLLVEEYIEGDEVDICMVGNANGVQVLQACLFDHDDDRKLYGAEEKKIAQGVGRSIVDRSLIPEQVWQSAQSLFEQSGKVEVMRLDGMLKNGSFTMVELSPDCSLRKTG
ncbi:MAG: hypothetical protein IJ087_19950, partial [Eggerthellaceae bacterium]|nr:hypothetical protein [Eggerthellaceae bacterium]